MAIDFVTPEQYQRGVEKIKKYVDDANVEATDEEVDAMLLEVLGGDYSVQS